MKTTNSIKYILILFFSGIFLTSCFKDLNTLPLDSKVLTGEQVFSNADGYRGVLAKCYASLILTGAKGGDGGNGDVPGIDEGYSGFIRCLFYLQVNASDEMVVNAGSSRGTRATLFMNWDPSTEIDGYPYYRLYMSIGYCNEFLKECSEEKLKARGLWEDIKADYAYLRAEARLIRAYDYSVLCDVYGSVPFIDESMVLGTVPFQKTRKEIFDYVVSEGEELTTTLKAPGTNEYGRVDQVAAWFLLARVYLNSESWLGINSYDKAYSYSKKIIANGTYPLAPDYRYIFLADNYSCKEIIWPLVQDADYAQGSAGTNFFIKALVNGAMNNYYMTGVGTGGWGNAICKTQLVDKFEKADQLFVTTDNWGDQKRDKRAQFFTVGTGRTKETWIVGKPFPNNFNNGYACIKWRNVTKDRLELKPGGTTYSSVDFPLFRTADAYLMAAEAILRGGGGTRTEALGYVNELRDRAYMYGSYTKAGIRSESGRITDAQLNLDFIIDERGRELYTELTRRTDLIRFNKYTKNNNWDWKGSDGLAGNYVGKDISDKFKLYPIPQNEFTVNPNLTQNSDYK